MKKLATLALIASLLGTQPQEVPVVYGDLPLNNILMVHAEQTREIPMCQFGYERDNIIYVNELKIPYIVSSTDSMASFYLGACDAENYLGLIHNHPSGKCSPGDTDLDRFINDERASIETVVCDTDLATGGIVMNQTLKRELPDSIIKEYKR